MTIKINVRALLDEAGLGPLDLVRDANLSPTTAYRLRDGIGGGIEFVTLDALCVFFSEKLGRAVGPGDILQHYRKNDNILTEIQP